MNMGVIFLRTDINIKVNDFLRKNVLNGITKESIKKILKI